MVLFSQLQIFGIFKIYKVITTFILVLLYTTFFVFIIFFYLLLRLSFHYFRCKQQSCKFFGNINVQLFVMPVKYIETENWGILWCRILLTSHYWWWSYCVESVCVCVCVCVHKAEHTAAETACFVFSSHSIIQALSSCFCFLSPNQQVAEGPVGNLYRYLDALDLLPEAPLSLCLWQYSNFAL